MIRYWELAVTGHTALINKAEITPRVTEKYQEPYLVLKANPPGWSFLVKRGNRDKDKPQM